MLIAYLDESYDQNQYFIGAAIGDEAAWEKVGESYEDIRGRTCPLHGLPSQIEFHGHELMGGKGDWSPLRGRHREAAGIYAAVLRAQRDAGISYLLRGVDIRRLHARYAYPRRPHDIVLGHLLERIDDFTAAQARAAGRTIIVADEIAHQAEHQTQFEAYQKLGTGGYRSSRLPHISAPINFADSRLTTGLQAVDMVTYVLRRSEVVTQQHPKAQRVTDRLLELIEPSVAHRHIWSP